MSRANLTKAFEAFFSPRTMAPFLVGALCMALVGNAVFLLLTKLVGDGPSAVVGIIIISVLLFLLALAAWVWQTGQAGFYRPEAAPHRRPPTPRRGLIFLVGRKEVCEEAVRAHEAKLERVWLVCSPQSNPTASALAADLHAARQLAVEVRIVQDAHDPLAFFQMIESIYAGLPAGWTRQDVIADYSGLTAHASVGMVMVCLELGAPLQYTPGEYDEQLKAIRPLPPFEVVLRGERVAPTPARRAAPVAGS